MSYLKSSAAKPKAALTPVAIPAQAANAGPAGIPKTELVAVVAPMAQAPPKTRPGAGITCDVGSARNQKAPNR